MTLSRIISESLKGLSQYKMRTFLMMLGIVIGSATLTTIVSISKGAQMSIMKNVKNFGPNSVMVTAGGGKSFGPPDERTTTLTLEDAQAIKDSIIGIRYLAPFTVHLEQNIIRDNLNTTSQVIGVTAEWMDAWQWYLEKGDFISDEDNAGLAKTCVLGQTVAKELFGTDNPIGETVRINNTSFKIIGILNKRGASPHGMDMDRRVVVPLTTAMKRLFNITHVGMIRLYIDDQARLDTVTTSVTTLLRERHHIPPPQEDDFRVTNSMAVAATVKGVSKTLTTFLMLLAATSMIVGGIVIANIMFISVNERKREIGIRRAFGARARDIMNQFLGEALFVTISGGIAGTILGFMLAKGVATASTTGIMGKKTMMPAVISWEPFALAFLFSVLIGVLAGVQPARKAAAMDPVESIRG